MLEHLHLARLVPYVAPSFCPLQSAYSVLHSTKTALLKIVNDMFEAGDLGRTTISMALDFSAAFDIIDHYILLSRLESSFGVSLVRPYLTEQKSTSFTKVGNASSPTTLSKTDVLQVSILWPLLVSLFTTPPGEVIFAFVYNFINMPMTLRFTSPSTKRTASRHQWML